MESGRGDRVGFVREIVAAHLPGSRAGSVVLLGEGEDNVAFEVDGELIVRFSKEPDPVRRAAVVSREVQLLAAVAGVSPLAVPEPCFAAAEQGCLGYLKLPGRQLIDLPLPQRAAHDGAIGAELGELLSALHDVPLGRVERLVDVDDQPGAVWLDEATATYDTIVADVPTAHRPAIEAFLGDPPPADGWPLVFSHNDLGIEHVLVDDTTWTCTGVIDWSDAAICDPARDFGLLYRDLGATALHSALRSYRADDEQAGAIRARAAFYARCGVLEDMAYGIETGRTAYLDKSLAALTWLYPA
ncbi:aminoglycoside phosphotransferase family protein [Streptomyces niveus]|uniref:phosphotransferase family protein n=1 Tax=Streptomyces niveus TaxID=193462 RepID=UPI0033EDD288